jgi:Sulfotransferase domain
MTKDVRTSIDVRLRPFAGPVVRHVGQLTSRLRARPSLLLVGTQRGGTTSLFRSLRQHPGFLGPIHRKGVHYFDVEYDRGPAWYVGHFPLKSTAARRSRASGVPVVVGEASPYYMAHPLAPRRIGEMLPSVKVIALLRDPIERAYSAYTHERARGYEHRSFEAAISSEQEVIEGEVARTLADPGYRSDILRHNAYLTRGHYAEQLERLERELGREHILVVDSHRFFENPEREFRRVLDFIGLPVHEGISHDQHNARPRLPLTPELRAMLEGHFASHDAALQQWLGWTPSWMSHRQP